MLLSETSLQRSVPRCLCSDSHTPGLSARTRNPGPGAVAGERKAACKPARSVSTPRESAASPLWPGESPGLGGGRRTRVNSGRASLKSLKQKPTCSSQVPRCSEPGPDCPAGGAPGRTREAGCTGALPATGTRILCSSPSRDLQERSRTGTLTAPGREAGLSCQLPKPESPLLSPGPRELLTG